MPLALCSQFEAQLRKLLCVAVHQKKATDRPLTGRPVRHLGQHPQHGVQQELRLPLPILMARCSQSEAHLRKLLWVAVHQKKATRWQGHP